MNRRWVRSQTNRVIGGVAAGLADYLNADPALIRIAWALLVIVTGGAAFLAYLVAWIVVPEASDVPYGAVAPPSSGEDGDPTGVTPAPVYAAAPPSSATGGDNRAGMIVGIGLVLLGVWFLVREYLPDINWGLLWPVVLIAVGILLLVAVTRGRSQG